jgi:hypothetical protein
MVVNFRARRISRGACKLVRTPMLIKKNYKRPCMSSLKKIKYNVILVFLK